MAGPIGHEPAPPIAPEELRSSVAHWIKVQRRRGRNRQIIDGSNSTMDQADDAIRASYHPTLTLAEWREAAITWLRNRLSVS